MSLNLVLHKEQCCTHNLRHICIKMIVNVYIVVHIISYQVHKDVALSSVSTVVIDKISSYHANITK